MAILNSKEKQMILDGLDFLNDSLVAHLNVMQTPAIQKIIEEEIARVIDLFDKIKLGQIEAKDLRPDS